MPTTIIDLIARLKAELEKHGSNIAVKIAGEDITVIDIVPAEGGFPAYLDIVGR